MTAWLKQSAQLLSLSRLELKAAVDRELLSNPLLEPVTDKTEETQAVRDGGAASSPSATQGSSTQESSSQDNDPPLRGREEEDESFAAGPAGESFQSNPLPSDRFATDLSATGRASAMRSGGPAEKTGLAPESRPDLFSGSFGKRRSQNHSSAAPSFESRLSETATLKSHLEQQARTGAFSKESKCFVLLLISHLDEKGRLPVSLKELSERESLSLDALEQALFILQTFDPPGVGARDIQECLLIQARSRKEHKEALSEIIKNHLPELAAKNYATLAARLKKPLEEVKALCEMIRSFTPCPESPVSLRGPAARSPADGSFYIAPDMYIYKEAGGGYKAFLHRESFPQIRFSSAYQDLSPASSKSKKELKQYLKDKTRSGRHFIHSLKQRRNVIVKVLKSVIERQKVFFEKGPSGLQPVSLKDIAEDAGVHVSTVSRAVSNKYVHTPRGVFPLKYFFTASHFLSEEGGTVAAESVKDCIQELIAGEDPKNPLTDEIIAEKINRLFQMKASRRVISKYRERAGLLPSKLRKKAAEHEQPPALHSRKERKA